MEERGGMQSRKTELERVFGELLDGNMWVSIKRGESFSHISCLCERLVGLFNDAGATLVQQYQKRTENTLAALFPQVIQMTMKQLRRCWAHLAGITWVRGGVEQGK